MEKGIADEMETALAGSREETTAARERLVAMRQNITAGRKKGKLTADMQDMRYELTQELVAAREDRENEARRSAAEKERLVRKAVFGTGG